MVNVFPVDLEYLQFVDLNEAEQQRLVDATIDAQLAPLIGNNTNTLILGTVLWEYNIDKNVRQNFQYFQKKCQDIGVRNHFLVGPEKKSILSDFDNCTFIDFFLLRSHHNSTQNSSTWHPENKKFLFLMGKAYKSHRIGLLYRFYKQGLLDINRCIWSFYNKISVDDCKGLVPAMATTQDLETLINNYQQSPDQVSPVNSHYGGFPFDPSMYINTNLSVVSETSIDFGPWNTEKIYRAILNHHPFLIAGCVGHTQYLQDMGFETFDQYFSVTDYSSIVNLDARLDAIVKNAKEFDPSAEQIEQIHQLTQKNSQRAHELAEHYANTIDQMFASYNSTVNWRNFLFREFSPHYLTWQFYYQKIKGPLWPPCDSIEDCINLPEQIQNELKTRFNLEF